MKATELRLGNYVYHESSTCKLETVLAFEDVEEYNPIPLTEEWLLKFGFAEQNDEKKERLKWPTVHTSISWVLRGNTPESDWFRVYQQIHEPDILDVKYDIRGIKLGEYRVYACLYFVKTIEYVHQLQNLYFAMTERELEIIT